ncbi:hypothetical protein CO676_25515 [Sinorhizobium sp. BJ1]|nr:hypothetical protein CO676_25515 [Sinorhizobium sp. BJ1]
MKDGRERLSWSREECEPVRRGRKQRTAVADEAIETKASFGHTRSIEVASVWPARGGWNATTSAGLTIIRHQAAQHSCLCSCPRQRCRPAPALDAIADVLGRIIVAPETKPRMLDGLFAKQVARSVTGLAWR